MTRRVLCTLGYAALLAACSKPSDPQHDTISVVTAKNLAAPAAVSPPERRLAAAPTPGPTRVPAPAPSVTPAAPPRHAFVDPPLPPELRD